MKQIVNIPGKIKDKCHERTGHLENLIDILVLLSPQRITCAK